MYNMDENGTVKYGECKEGHLHAVRSQFLLNLWNVPNEPMSYMFHRECTSKDRVFVSDTLKVGLFECPNNYVYMNPSPFISPRSSTADEDSLRGATNFVDENMLNVFKAKQDEILNMFKIETGKTIENFGKCFAMLHSELEDITRKVNSCKDDVAQLKEEIRKQAVAIESSKNPQDSEDEEINLYGSSETLNAEIRAIKRDRRKCFIDYLRSNKELNAFKPIILSVKINGISVYAAHDPRIPHSIISIDLLRSEDRWEEVNETIFLIPWRQRKLQSCDEIGFVTMDIGRHALSFEIFVSSYWTRKVLLGNNFFKTHVDSLDESRMKIRLYDDQACSFSTPFEWFEMARLNE